MMERDYGYFEEMEVLAERFAHKNGFTSYNHYEAWNELEDEDEDEDEDD